MTTTTFSIPARRVFGAIFVFLAFFITVIPAAASANAEVVLDESYYTNAYGYTDQDSFLGRGINLGNVFEAPKSVRYPLGEGEWSGGHQITQTDLHRIRSMGFKNVRIPARWSDHALKEAPYTIDPAFLSRVRDVVDQAMKEGFIVVLNTHHYNEMMYDPRSALDAHRARLNGIWTQLCSAFPVSEYPADKLVFELLNEPHSSVNYDDWNEMIHELVEIIWTDNAALQNGRKIMIGTANWGGVPGLKKLELPKACTRDTTIITVHYYEPFKFTHQGAEWSDGAKAWIGTTWTGSRSEQAPLVRLLDSIVEWNTEGFEVYVGEFGAYSKHIKPEYQKAWTAFIAREAEKRQMSWAYWEYFSGFGAWDPKIQQWRPHVIDALIPIADQPPR